MADETIAETDLATDAALMGYRRPRCGTCRYALLPKEAPDHGLCRISKLGRYHLAPINSWELCEQWEPRWGMLKQGELLTASYEAEIDRQLEQSLRRLDQECEAAIAEAFPQSLAEPTWTRSQTGEAVAEAFAGW